MTGYKYEYMFELSLIKSNLGWMRDYWNIEWYEVWIIKNCMYVYG